MDKNIRGCPPHRENSLGLPSRQHLKFIVGNKSRRQLKPCLLTRQEFDLLLGPANPAGNRLLLRGKWNAGILFGLQTKFQMGSWMHPSPFSEVSPGGGGPPFDKQRNGKTRSGSSSRGKASRKFQTKIANRMQTAAAKVGAASHQAT